MSGKSTVDGNGELGGDKGEPGGSTAATDEVLHAVHAVHADLVLYGTSACHLCEEAERLLRPWVAGGLRVAVDDISESDELFERYGLHIPVLRRCDTGVELHWPFDPDDIARFLSA
jgi:hypothetical protein